MELAARGVSLDFSNFFFLSLNLIMQSFFLLKLLFSNSYFWNIVKHIMVNHIPCMVYVL